MRVRAVAVVFLAAFAASPVAHANGDPASDFLLSQDTFLPVDAKIPKDELERLDALVRDANEKGVPIKLAVIASRADLGAVPSLWRKPQTYARFLGQEIFFVYKDRLVIVMPNGYGVARGGVPQPAEQRVVDALPKPGEGGALAAAATRAVQRLAARKGVQVEAAQSDSSETRDRILIASGAALLLALVAGGVFVGRRLRRR